MSYQSAPQHPDTLPGFRAVTRRGIEITPDLIRLLTNPESLLEAVYSPDEDLRLTAREFLGWGVPRLPPMPRGEVAICTRCNLPKALRDFTPDERKRNGRRSWCKDCERDQRRLDRSKNTMVA